MDPIAPPPAADAAGAPLRRGALAFILVTVVLDILALGMIIPIIPMLVVSLAGGEIASGAMIYGLFGTAWALMQFIFQPLLGALSDRVGRRPVILISNFGLACAYVMTALAPSLAWLLVARIVSGITAASVSTAYAYVSDVVPPDKRAPAFGKLGAAFGLGFVLGPAVGGLLGDIDPRLPFWIAAAMSFANGLYGLFVLPESLPPEKRGPVLWRRANPFGSLMLLRSHRELSALAVVGFLSALAHASLPAVSVLYVTYRYGFDALTVGLTLAGVGVCTMIVQGGLVGPIVKRLGERRTLILGLLLGALGFAGQGLAPTSWLYWSVIPLQALWGLANPAAQGLMTRRVHPTEQGRLQGAVGSIRGVTDLIGPTLFTQTFAHFIASGAVYVPGAPMLLAGALLLIGAGVATRTGR